MKSKSFFHNIMAFHHILTMVRSCTIPVILVSQKRKNDKIYGKSVTTKVITSTCHKEDGISSKEVMALHLKLYNLLSCHHKSNDKNRGLRGPHTCSQNLLNCKVLPQKHLGPNASHLMCLCLDSPAIPLASISVNLTGYSTKPERYRVRNTLPLSSLRDEKVNAFWEILLHPTQMMF